MFKISQEITSERLKIAIFDNSTVIWHLLSCLGNPREIRINLILRQTRIIRVHFRHKFILFRDRLRSPKSHAFKIVSVQTFKVIQGRWFWYNRKRVCNFLLDQW